jgi:transketolase
LQPITDALPLLIGGSADLYGSTLNYINKDKDFDASNRAGRNIRFGIREHAMCAMLNGVAYHGIFRPSGATFLVFADYCRPSIRLASLARLPVIYIFTHDSVGVGEDGPTHQPVETVSGLRVIPNLDVIRPGDPEETAGAFVAAVSRTDGPTLIALTRQAIPIQNDIPIDLRRDGVAKGAYVAIKETGALKVIILATGSELQHAINAAIAWFRCLALSVSCARSKITRTKCYLLPAGSELRLKQAQPSSGPVLWASTAKSSGSTVSA